MADVERNIERLQRIISTPLNEQQSFQVIERSRNHMQPLFAFRLIT